MIAPQAKRDQETFSLRHIGDNFRKLVVTGDPYEKPCVASANFASDQCGRNPCGDSPRSIASRKTW